MEPTRANRRQEFFRNHWPGLLLFALAVVIGLLTYQQYGVNWDDPYQRVIGLVSYNYITGKNADLLTYVYNMYGPAYEVLLVCIEKLLGVTDSRDIFLSRHLVTHLYFLVGVLCMYLLAYRVFRKQWIAVLCFLMMIFAPRIYAHSFFNTKDIPFLSTVCIFLYLAALALTGQKKRYFIAAGMAAGFATSIRIMGIMFPVFLCGFIVIDMVQRLARKEKLGPSFLALALFILAYGMATYASFPFLWRHPWGNFVYCFQAMSHYPWHGVIFQNGVFIHADNIPWYVFFVWFGITNPVGWLATGVLGICFFCVRFIKSPRSFLKGESQVFLFCFLSFAAPILSVLVLNAVFYEDWRHLYFVYPAFVVLAAYGINIVSDSVSDKKWMGRFLFGGIGLQLIVVAFTMCRVFPINQVYYNVLVGYRSEYFRNNFEMDYWAVGFKQAVDHILTSDPKTPIRLATDRAGFASLENNIMMLSPSDRSRLNLVGAGDPSDYFLTNYRGHPQEYDSLQKIDSIYLFNSTVIGIYRGRN